MSEKHKTYHRLKTVVDGEQILCHTTPRLKSMVSIFAEKQDTSVSKVVQTALNQFFNNMPPEERAKFTPSNKNSY